MITTWAELADMYTEELAAARKRYPQMYMWPEQNTPTVVSKMITAFKARSYSNDGYAIKGLARRCGIKPTYTELNNLFATLK